MSPPIVYEETRPSSQRMIKMTAMTAGSNLWLDPPFLPGGVSSLGPCPPHPPKSR